MGATCPVRTAPGQTGTGRLSSEPRLWRCPCPSCRRAGLWAPISACIHPACAPKILPQRYPQKDLAWMARFPGSAVRVQQARTGRRGGGCHRRSSVHAPGSPAVGKRTGLGGIMVRLGRTCTARCQLGQRQSAPIRWSTLPHDYAAGCDPDSAPAPPSAGRRARAAGPWGRRFMTETARGDRHIDSAFRLRMRWQTQCEGLSFTGISTISLCPPLPGSTGVLDAIGRRTGHCLPSAQCTWAPKQYNPVEPGSRYCHREHKPGQPGAAFTVSEADDVRLTSVVTIPTGSLVAGSSSCPWTHTASGRYGMEAGSAWTPARTRSRLVHGRENAQIQIRAPR